MEEDRAEWRVSLSWSMLYKDSVFRRLSEEIRFGGAGRVAISRMDSLVGCLRGTLKPLINENVELALEPCLLSMLGIPTLSDSARERRLCCDSRVAKPGWTGFNE